MAVYSHIKNNEISNEANLIKLKKIDSSKYNVIDIGAGYGESTLAISNNSISNRMIACEKFIDGINKIDQKSSKN